MHDKHRITEEPCNGKLLRTVLESSGSRERVTDFNSKCGHEVKKTLSTRTHKCPHCGYLDDRDTNAAINILMKALQGLAQLPRGTRKVTSGEEKTLCLDGETRKSKVARGARKSHQR